MCLRCVNACDAATPSKANGRGSEFARAAKAPAPGVTARRSARRRPAAANSRNSFVRGTRGGGRETVMSTRDQTGLVTGQAIPADDRARLVDRAGRGNADLPL